MSVNYKAPVAEAVCFETVEIITTSVEVVDNPDNLGTWGARIEKFASEEVDLFGKN
ncbi:MAG: hypothetical protein IKU61_04750 [Clostridia bacterium]|nr:hypothetical protein [Clostridia bacterium]